jgi:curved DNA-binding protein CbpA
MNIRHYSITFYIMEEKDMKQYYFFMIMIITVFFMGQSYPMETPNALPPLDFNISNAELEEMMKYIESLKPEEIEELERMGKQVLTEMGYNPETLEPLTQSPELKPISPPESEKIAETVVSTTPIPAKVETPPSEYSENTIKILFEQLTDHLGQLRQKIAETHNQRLHAWSSDLHDLVFFLLILSKKHHYKNLAAREHVTLVKSLKQLAESLSIYVPLLINSNVINQDTTDNPYHILGVSQKASQQEIEKAYETLTQNLSPESVASSLKEQGASNQNLVKAQKEARLSFTLITDAYEILKDPKSRSQFDRQYTIEQKNRSQAELNSRQATDSIINALTQAFHEQKLISSLEQFIKKYEPEELNKKKELDAAHKQRQKEQEALSKLTSRPSPGGPYEQPGYRQSSYERPERGPSFFNSPMPSFTKYSPSSYEPSAPSTTQKTADGSKKISKGKDKEGKSGREDDKASKTTEEKKPKKSTASKDEKDKNDAFDLFANQVTQIDTQLFTLNNSLDENMLKDVEKLPLQELTNVIDSFTQTTQLLAIANSLTALSTRAKAVKDPRKKKQYSSLWNTVNNNYKELEQKRIKFQDILTSKINDIEKKITKSPQDSEGISNFRTLLNSTSQAMETINTNIAKINDTFKSTTPKNSFDLITRNTQGRRSA